MERIRTLLIQGKEIVAIDYSNLKEADMIALAIDAKKYLMKTEGPKFIIKQNIYYPGLCKAHGEGL